jgi:gliding motility-associated protein GldM
MSLPKEPRQLMINLMYLVLTAMLALNVSSEILHAFKTINQSILSSNTSIADKNEKLYKSFQDQEDDPVTRDRIKQYNDKAKIVKAASAEMIKYLDEWKERVIIESGGREEDSSIKREDNIDASTLLLVERKGGDSLKSKLVSLRGQMLGVVRAEDKAQLDRELPIKIADPERSDNNPQGDWSTGYFYNMPTMAVITLLSKFQNDIKNSEAMTINQLSREAGDIVVKFDEVEAIAVPQTSYALVGQKVEARILLAAYNKSANPIVSSSSGRVTKVENGVATWETTASGVGPQTIRGNVKLDLGGRIIEKPYTFNFMVGSTGASIQLDKMNVFYIGVPNPITITAAGYSIEDVSVSIPGATATKTANGKYDVMVTSPGKVMADILAKTQTGGSAKVGSMEVRVKNIPDPIGKVGGKTGGPLSSAVFKAQSGIPAVLENFDFDAKFIVTSFEFSWLPKRGEYQGPFTTSGALFSGNKQVDNYQKSLAKPGDRVFIENIKARGPDGRTRTLGSINLTLN